MTFLSIIWVILLKRPITKVDIFEILVGVAQILSAFLQYYAYVRHIHCTVVCSDDNGAVNTIEVV